MIVKPPPPDPVKNVSYPDIPGQKLPNGLQVMVVRDNRLPEISVKLAFRVGRVSNPDENLALLELAAELIKEGTGTRSARQISDLMDRWAIQYDGAVYMEHSLFSWTFLEHVLEPALELASDVVLNPTFPARELEKLKLRWKSHLIAQRSQPDFLATERIFHAFYPGHPYSRVSIPLEHLEVVQPESVREIYRRYFSPAHAYLLFAGDIYLDQAMILATRFFGEWKAPEPPTVDYPSLPEVPRGRVCLVHRPHSVQSRVMVSGRTLPRAHPQAVTLRLANEVLGGGASSRLFLNLREEKGYTYGVYSDLKMYLRDGLFLIGADVKTEMTLESLKEILKELERMWKAPPIQEELDRSRSELTGAFIRQMQTPASVGTLELIRLLCQLPQDYYRDFIPQINAVTEESVVEISKRFFNPHEVLITVVADRSTVGKALQELGQVEVYDSQGNQL